MPTLALSFSYHCVKYSDLLSAKKYQTENHVLNTIFQTQYKSFNYTVEGEAVNQRFIKWISTRHDRIELILLIKWAENTISKLHASKCALTKTVGCPTCDCQDVHHLWHKSKVIIVQMIKNIPSSCTHWNVVRLICLHSLLAHRQPDTGDLILRCFLRVWDERSMQMSSFSQSPPAAVSPV